MANLGGRRREGARGRWVRLKGRGGGRRGDRRVERIQVGEVETRWVRSKAASKRKVGEVEREGG